MTSVSGSERLPAFLMSRSKISLNAFSELASPNCSTRTSGCAFCAAFVSRSVSSTIFPTAALSLSPSMSKLTMAVWPSEEMPPARVV